MRSTLVFVACLRACDLDLIADLDCHNVLTDDLGHVKIAFLGPGQAN